MEKTKFYYERDANRPFPACIELVDENAVVPFGLVVVRILVEPAGRLGQSISSVRRLAVFVL